MKEQGFNIFLDEYNRVTPSKIKLPDFKNPKSRRYMNDEIINSAKKDINSIGIARILKKLPLFNPICLMKFISLLVFILAMQIKVERKMLKGRIISITLGMLKNI